jgi:hypothetical protein
MRDPRRGPHTLHVRLRSPLSLFVVSANLLYGFERFILQKVGGGVPALVKITFTSVGNEAGSPNAYP